MLHPKANYKSLNISCSYVIKRNLTSNSHFKGQSRPFFCIAKEVDGRQHFLLVCHHTSPDHMLVTMGAASCDRNCCVVNRTVRWPLRIDHDGKQYYMYMYKSVLRREIHRKSYHTIANAITKSCKDSTGLYFYPTI